MEKINIGFIGGCINKQKGIKRSELFYSVISQKLKNKIDVNISLYNYHSYESLPEDVELFINKKKPNVLCLFIRPFPLMPLNKVFIKHIAKNGKKRIALHPQIFFRKKRWDINFSAPETGPYNFKKVNKLSLKDVNIIAGFALGINHWGTQFIIDRVEKVNNLCQSKNIKLILVSPPKYTASLMSNLICSRLTANLKAYCDSKIKYVNINEFNDFEEDKIHFSTTGHKNLGEAIFQKINDILKYNNTH